MCSFDVVEWAWNNGVPIKGLPEQDDMPIPPFPEDGEENKHSILRYPQLAYQFRFLRSDFTNTCQGASHWTLLEIAIFIKIAPPFR